MSIETGAFGVVVEPYAVRHYIKEYEKKYGSWSVTWDGLLKILSRFDAQKLGSVAAMIEQSRDGTRVIYKFEFRVAEQKVSAKASGNRMIVMVDYVTRLIRVLLVYHKNHILGERETDWWKVVIKSEYGNLL